MGEDETSAPSRPWDPQGAAAVAPGPQLQRADSGGVCQEATHSLGLKGQPQTWAAWRGRRQINISTTTFQVKTAVQRGKVTCRDAQRQGRDLPGGSPREPPAQRGRAWARRPALPRRTCWRASEAPPANVTIPVPEPEGAANPLILRGRHGAEESALPNCAPSQLIQKKRPRLRGLA